MTQKMMIIQLFFETVRWLDGFYLFLLSVES
jgi:hypothetical protein